MPLFAASSQVHHDSFKNKKFVGKVVDNNDPKKLQRCKVRCRGIHDGVPDDDLAWAVKLQGAGGGGTKVDVPPLGTEVIVEFQDDTLYHPLYYGTRQTISALSSELTGTNYPHQINEIDRTGNLIVRDTTTNEFIFTHISGTTIHIDGSGNVTIKVAKSLSIETQTPMNFTSLAAINIKSMAAINIEGVGGVNLRGPTNINDKGPSVTAPAAPGARGRPAETPFTGDTTY